jgi:hypothetical protein
MTRPVDRERTAQPPRAADLALEEIAEAHWPGEARDVRGKAVCWSTDRQGNRDPTTPGW